MSPMMMLGMIWAVITAALVIVLIYRSTLSMHEDDQLFIDESTANLRAEQEALLKRMNQITRMVRILGSGLRTSGSRYRRNVGLCADERPVLADKHLAAEP